MIVNEIPSYSIVNFHDQITIQNKVFNLKTACPHCLGHKSEHWNDIDYQGDYQLCHECEGQGTVPIYYTPDFIAKQTGIEIPDHTLVWWLMNEGSYNPYFTSVQYRELKSFIRSVTIFLVIPFQDKPEVFKLFS